MTTQASTTLCPGCKTALLHPQLKREREGDMMFCGKPECREKIRSMMKADRLAGELPLAPGNAAAMMRAASDPYNGHAMYLREPDGSLRHFDLDDTINIPEETLKRDGKPPEFVHLKGHFNDVQLKADGLWHFINTDGKDVLSVKNAADALAIIMASKRNAMESGAFTEADAESWRDLEQRVAAIASQDVAQIALLCAKSGYESGIQVTPEVRLETLEGDGVMTWRFRDGSGAETLTTSDADVAKAKIDEILTPLSAGARRRVLEGVHKQLSAQARRFEREQQSNAKHIMMAEQLKSELSEQLKELMRWQKDGLRLQRLEQTAWHKLQEALQNNLVFSPWKNALVGTSHHPENAQTFVVEHDWAAAFKGAEDFDEGEVPLPYEGVIFEFRISQRRVIAVMSEQRCAIFVEGHSTKTQKQLWMIPQVAYTRTPGVAWDWKPLSVDMETMEPMPPDFVDHFTPLKDMVLGQVRSIMIALDADVAVSDRVTAPAKLNKARVKSGKAPLPDYHVVRLNRSARTAARDATPAHADRRRPRMHFRRGHYTHLDREPMTNRFNDWKPHEGRWRRWRKWMLVGDPDLGFIDKEYRL